ncbi:hypothetical protein PybrP1_013179 [[Pythium] brassicae (nom. inval.)]|nr:hypothetical protein PybrP1_013179 [[Pythium] brassicae (nom. inval.)]
MNEGEFHRALERFPVVRKKTYARVEWNALHGSAAAQDTPATLLGDATQSAIQESDSLRDATGKFLDAFFSAQEITRIQREFEKAQRAFVASLCLEDVDDLCAQFVDAQQQQ